MNSHYAVFLGLFSALCDVTIGDTTTRREVVGKNISVGCSFSWASTNKKFFCRGKEKKNCTVLIETTNNNEVKGRYTIEDKKETGVFYVTITGLEKSDAGTYWCGVERSALNVLSETHQKVIIVVDEASTSQTTTVSSVKVTSPGRMTVSGTFFPISTSYQRSPHILPKESLPNTSPEDTSSGAIVFVVAGLVVMVTLLGMATLIFCRKKICTPPEHSNIPVDTDCAVVNEAVYEEIREENRQSNLTPVNVCTVYSCVSSTSPTTNIHPVNESRNINSEVFSLGETNAFTDPPTAESINTATVGYADEDFYSLAQLPSGTGGGNQSKDTSVPL